jgi:hypothetical protein
MTGPDSPQNTQYAPLSAWERIATVGLFVSLVGFGGLVEIRSAFLSRHMTDLDVYLRAAWAVRTGADFYSIMDDNGWHYHYPPLFAILLVPLADPPFGCDRSGMVPFAVSVSIWYAFSLLCLFGAVHWMAGTLEQTSADPAVRSLPAGCRRWWALRAWPVLACLPPVGHTLMRGQVNLLLLLLICGMAVAVLRGRSWQAGFWLAGAICLKIIPAFLLVYPLWRRDLRCLAGCALGLILGLIVVPVSVFGPTKTWQYYREWNRALGQPALAEGTDQSRAKELIEVTATDSQSYRAVLHNTLNPVRETRPPYPTSAVRWLHWILGGALTLISLLAAGWRRIRASETETILLGLLVVMMLLLSPVCHLHYLSLAIPLAMGIMARLWKDRSTLQLGGRWCLLFAVHFVAVALPHFPRLEYLRDFGVAMYGALLLWLGGLRILGQHSAVLSRKHEVSTAVEVAA